MMGDAEATVVTVLYMGLKVELAELLVVMGEMEVMSFFSHR